MQIPFNDLKSQFNLISDEIRKSPVEDRLTNTENQDEYSQNDNEPVDNFFVFSFSNQLKVKHCWEHKSEGSAKQGAN